MRQISVSTEVFSLIWAARKPGEESENDILLRILSKKETEKPKEPKMNATGLSDLAAMRDAYWWQVVQCAMERLGRPSSLSEIYGAVKAVCETSGKRMPQELEATVRGTLEDNSSDSDRFKGVRDIFCMPDGKHTGVWALRRRA